MRIGIRWPAMLIAGCLGIGFSAGGGTSFVPDEPDEINPDRLGGTLVTFDRFAAYCEAHPDYKAKLLACEPVDSLPEEVEVLWYKPESLAEGATLCEWRLGEVGGERVITTHAGHGGGCVRRAVEIPASGFYRVWVRYHHVQGQAASFGFSLEDGRLADERDLSLTVVQDAWYYRFDFTEHGRRNPLPDFKDEPTGFKWESAPLVWLEKGRKTMTISGIVHGGPFGVRAVSDIVLTREPLAVPEKSFGGTAGKVKLSGKFAACRALYLRRPRLGAGDTAIQALWREWEKAYMAFLAGGGAERVAEKRLAETVYFDPESNLVGTPRQVADGKAKIRAFIAAIDRVHFKERVEVGDFTVDRKDGSGSFYPEGTGLGAGWWGGECSAHYDFTVPTAGVYRVWLRYTETAGYLAPFTYSVEDMDGTLIAKRELGNDKEMNRRGGSPWVSLEVKTGGKFRIRLAKNVQGQTYRHLLAVIVSDDPDFVPVFDEQAIPPYDTAKPLTVWRSDPWAGYSRTSFPKRGENLEPFTVDLREGEAETVLLLARNNTDRMLEITPVISGEAKDLITWRVPAFVYTGTEVFDWQPMPLFRRAELFAPAGETVGVWLTVKGEKGFKDGKATVRIGEETFDLTLNRREPWGKEVPVPYVFPWTNPYAHVSSWELFRELGINVLLDPLVSKAEAERYGIRLVVHLNDGDVSTNHVRYLRARYERMGYSVKDWAWSFMDEPGERVVNEWVGLAERLRTVDDTIRLWCNPGELTPGSVAASMRMSSYVNVYCPYCNHFATQDAAYAKRLRRGDGNRFDILLGYTTPDVGATEKSPGSPYLMVGMSDFALQNNLDGWAFLALVCSYPYCNSVWDEVNAFSGDQAVSLYPGAQWHTMSSRFAEGIREAVQRWRRAKAGTARDDGTGVSGRGA